MSIDKEETNKEITESIARAIKGIKHGYIQVVIHNSKVVQIDKTEKMRLDNNSDKGGGVRK